MLQYFQGGESVLDSENCLEIQLENLLACHNNVSREGLKRKAISIMYV